MHTVEVVADTETAVFVLVSAFLWYRSTRVKARLIDDGGFAISEDGYDLFETAKLQTRWSRYASLAAAVSAIFQGIAALVVVIIS